MTEWAYLFKIGIALFAIVNPIGSLPIFISATDGWSTEDRARTARTAAFTVFLVLVASAFFGDGILAFFSISIPSFQVGGGILLMLNRLIFIPCSGLLYSALRFLYSLLYFL